MTSNVTIPSGMSRTGTLEGLWKCSKPAYFFQTIPNGDLLRRKQEADAWNSKTNVEKTIKKHPYIDYFGGRCIKTDMSKFPQVDLESYKQRCSIDKSYMEIFEKCIKASSR